MAKIKELIAEQGGVGKAFDDYEDEPALPPGVWQSTSGALIVPIGLIETRKQPRNKIDFIENEEDKLFLADISQSIADGAGIEGTGIDTPISLAPHPDDPSRYLLTFGHRRHAAVTEAGGAYVPAIVRERSRADAWMAGIKENVNRKAISAVEEGDAYLEALGMGLTIPQVAQKAGQPEHHINKRLASARKPEVLRVMQTLRSGTMEHARLLEFVTDKEEQKRLADDVVKKKLTTDQIREELKVLQRKGKAKSSKIESRPRKESGSIGRGTTSKVPLVDWDGKIRELDNGAFEMFRVCRDTPPKGKHKKAVLDALAKAEKDIRAARQAIGPMTTEDE